MLARHGISKGSIRRVAILAAPPQLRSDATEDDKAAHAILSKVAEDRKDEQISVVLIGRLEAIDYRIRMQRVWGSKPDPETTEWIREWRDLHREIVVACVRGVHGLYVDGKEIGSTKPERICELLDDVDSTALLDVARATLRAQELTREESDFLGSSAPIAAAPS